MNINIGIIGPGRIADAVLAPSISQVDGAVLWSVLSRDLTRAAAFAETHNAASGNPAYTDLKQLLADPELDAVIVATPDKLHAEQVIACAEAGKHVLVEKPMATDVADARAMVDACQAADVRLGVAYHLRWHNGHRKLVELVRSGGLGNLRHMRVQRTWKADDASNWRASPEVGRWWSLAGVGTHCLDLIRWVMVPSCGEVVSIKSIISSAVWKGPHDETAVVSMRFASGATAEFCSSVLFKSPHKAEIYGDDGYALCEETLGRDGKGSIELNGEPLDFQAADPYAGEIRDFVTAIRENRPAEVDGTEGLRNVELLVAAASE